VVQILTRHNPKEPIKGITGYCWDKRAGKGLVSNEDADDTFYHFRPRFWCDLCFISAILLPLGPPKPYFMLERPVSSLYHRGFAPLLCCLSLQQNKTPFQKTILLNHSDKLLLKKDLKRHYKSY
jgi:hypothetical protein